MVVRAVLQAFCVFCAVATAGLAQTLPKSAAIEAVPLDLTMPENYQVTSVLESSRRISLVAPADGIIRGLEVPLGTTVKASQEVAQLDRAEALARLRIAQAELKEKQAVGQAAQSHKDLIKSQIEAAEARVELAQLQLDRLTLKAPFTGRLVALPVSSGQYVLKGTVVAEIADVTTLRSLVPVDRRTVKEGGQVKVFVEEQEQGATVQSILPLPESYASLRGLAAPFAAAWMIIPNTKGELSTGERVRSATLPVTPLATIAQGAIHAGDQTDPAAAARPTDYVQVIRNEYVTNIPVQVLGKIGHERIQVTGPLRETDSLIVASSVPLLPGTLVRFTAQSSGSGVEGTTPSPDRRGAEAGIVAPARPAGESGAANTPSSRPQPSRPTTKKAASPAQPSSDSPPF